MQLLEQWG
uniref:Uncharacterized protein n=1 Tax=Anguilla anguilla TaxID=7936 RepID=A0A0E9PU17_ANGAN